MYDVGTGMFRGQSSRSPGTTNGLSARWSAVRRSV